MQTELDELQKTLEIEDIEFRVAEAKPYMQDDKLEGAYCHLLAYKDARTDMKRLDSVCGIEGWQNKYFRDSNGVLQCGIGIWSSKMNEWIWKYSNGVPSNFESEKGEYSDAMKRAGFMWGIGRELYDMPDIRVWLHSNEFKASGQNKYGRPNIKINYNFKPNSWHWKVDWKHEGTHGDRGLVWAKEAKADSKYRVKPIAIYKGPNHKS